MKRIALALLPVFVVTVAFAQSTFRGTWSADLNANRVLLRTDFNRGDNHYGNTFEVSRAELKPGASPGSVDFNITRDAGTFHYSGTMKNDLASGFVDFTPNPEFAPGMAQLGYTNLTPDQVFRMAHVDVTRQFVRGLNDVGYKNLGIEQLVRMALHDADSNFIRALESAGYKDLSPEQVVRLRIHDVTPEFVKQMAADGFTNLDAGELVRMKIHDVDPDFVAAIRKLGFTNLNTEDLVRMKIHDVTPDFIAKLKQLGFADITPEEAVRLRIHDVSADDVAQAKAAQQNISLEEIIRMKIHGGRRARL
jgi:hypothetical protein